MTARGFGRPLGSRPEPAHPEPRGKKTLARKVEFRRTIAHYDRRLPPVLSTPSMIGQMEVAAALLLQPHLPPGWISVGTHINVAHVAAATVGQTLRVTAAFERRRRRRLVFTVEAKVGRKTIGYGTVERAIVHRERFARRTHEPRRP